MSQDSLDRAIEPIPPNTKLLGYSLQVKMDNGHNQWTWWDEPAFECWEFLESAIQSLHHHKEDEPESEWRVVEVREVIDGSE